MKIGKIDSSRSIKAQSYGKTFMVHFFYPISTFASVLRFFIHKCTKYGIAGDKAKRTIAFSGIARPGVVIYELEPPDVRV